MDIIDYTHFSPFETALAGRDDAGRQEIFSAFAALPDAFRVALSSPATAQRIADWEAAGLFPSNYRTAIAKTVMLSALREVQLDSLSTLYRRIGLSEEQAGQVAENVRALVEPFLTSAEPEIPDVTLDPEAGEPEELREIPPLTSVSPAPTSLNETAADQTQNQSVPNQPSRNIIDLRKQA